MTSLSPPVFAQRHLLGIEHLNRLEIEALLDLSDEAVAISRQVEKKRSTLRGRTQINLFFEASTRTQSSFELAGKRLSADVINISGSTSSAVKGETLLDTVKNLTAMHPDVVVIRHFASGAPHFVAERTKAAVINAGDGTHEHPTQALLDAFTIRRAKGRLAGLTVAICGDVAHSRVARSNAHLLGAMGATVRFAGPRTLLPAAAEALGATVYDRIEPALEGVDVVMMLRVQQERMSAAFFPTVREYRRRYGQRT